MFYGYVPFYSYTRKSDTLEFKLLLIDLVQKHSNLVKPGLDPIDQAKADLEMWINVMNEIHSLGYTNTLASVQSLWNKMKSNARLAQKSTGPMTYLDYLVNNCEAKISIINDATDSSHTLGSEETESCDSDITEKINYVPPESPKNNVPKKSVANDDKNTITLESLLSRPVEVITVTDNHDVICIDDDSEMEENSKKDLDKDAKSARSGATGSNNCDNNRKKNKNTCKITRTSDALRKIRIRRWV